MARHLSPGPHTSVLVALLLLLSAASASAQTRLYILFSGDTGDQCQPQNCEPGRVFEVDVDGRRFQAATPVAHARYNATGPVITPDGRYLLWNGSEAAGSGLAFLSLFDTASRQQSLVSATSSRGFTVPLFAHPSAMRVFYQPDFAQAITVAEPDGSHTLSVMCADGVLSGESGDGSRLFVRCRTTPVIPSRTIAIDSTSGARVGEVPLGPFRQASNDTGTELYTWTRVSNLPVFRRYDVASGGLLASQPGTAEDRSDGPMQIDPRTGDLFADAADGLHVLDGSTLATIARVASPSPCASARFVFDPDEPVMFVVWTVALSAGGYRSRIAMIDTNTFATIAEADLPLDIAVVGMVMGPRPPRAVNLSSTVAIHSVMLEWTNQESRSIATGLVVEAGSRPGATNLARLCVAAGTTSLSVPNVPPGTYYVRVRSVNGTGNGEPSNEIAVVVP